MTSPRGLDDEDSHTGKPNQCRPGVPIALQNRHLLAKNDVFQLQPRAARDDAANERDQDQVDRLHSEDVAGSSLKCIAAPTKGRRSMLQSDAKFSGTKANRALLPARFPASRLTGSSTGSQPLPQAAAAFSVSSGISTSTVSVDIFSVRSALTRTFSGPTETCL